MRYRQYFCSLVFSFLVVGCVFVCSCPPKQEQRKLSLSYGDTEIYIGMDADALVTLLGKDHTLSVAQRCAGEGEDRIYTDPSMRLYVFAPKDEIAIVTAVCYTDDGVSTKDGLTIGSTSAHIRAALGEPTEQTEDKLIYRTTESALSFTVRDDRAVAVWLTENNQGE